VIQKHPNRLSSYFEVFNGINKDFFLRRSCPLVCHADAGSISAARSCYLNYYDNKRQERPEISFVSLSKLLP
jgi:hypothetical protein